MSSIFGEDYLGEHIGGTVKYRDRLHKLEEVESYFVELCKKNGIGHSIDCTANERTYYRTINCTTYAGMFIAHPLCFSATLFQMFDAKVDRMAPGRHLEWVKSNIDSGEGSKYIAGRQSDSQDCFDEKFDCIAVLPGTNKIYQHVESKRLQSLIVSLGDKLILKPHPLTTNKVIKDLNNVKGKSHLASRTSDLYRLMKKAKTVYTTHISETALTGLLLGKRVEPLDPFDNRLTGAFAHINHFCFSEPDPIKAVGSIMASPKSGVIHPDIDSDWRQKLRDYFEYTLSRREIQKGFYL